LNWVYVNAGNRVGSGKEVVKGVAAGRCDDEHIIFTGEFKGFAIDSRVFPAGIIH